MSPIRSTISRSLGFFIRNRRSQDATGTSAIMGTRQDSSPTSMTVPSSISGPGKWDLSSQGNLVITTAGTYDISPFNHDRSIIVDFWGAGGGRGRSAAEAYGAAGVWATTGSFKMGINNPMNYVCGGANGSGGSASGGPGTGGTPQQAGHGGGFSGLFNGSVAIGNAWIVAAGGGGGANNDAGNNHGSGGAGGTTTGSAGGTLNSKGSGNAPGGTQSAGGTAGSGSPSHIMVLLDQLSKEATEDPVAVVVHLVAVAAVDTTAAVAAVVMKARTIMAVVEVEDPLISAQQIFPLLHILPQGQDFVIQEVQ